MENANTQNKYEYTKIILGLFFCMLVAGEIVACVTIYKGYYNVEKRSIHNGIDIFTTNMKPQMNLLMARIQSVLSRTTSLFRIDCINKIYITQDDFNDAIGSSGNPISSVFELIVWIPKLLNSELQTYQSFCVNNISSECLIKDKNDTSFIPVGNRSVYYPLVLVFPENNKYKIPYDSLFGLDFYNDNSTKEYIDIALSKGGPTATSKIFLVNSTFSIVINQPVYKSLNLQNSSKPVNQSDIYGILMASLNITNMFNTLLGLNINLNRLDIDVFVFDISPDIDPLSNKSLLFKESKKEYENVTYEKDIIITEYTTHDVYNINGRLWSIYYVFSNNYIQQHIDNNKYIITFVVTGIFMLVDILYIILIIVNKKNIKFERDKRMELKKIIRFVNHELRNPLNVVYCMMDQMISSFKKTDDITAKGENISVEDNKVTIIITDTKQLEILKKIINEKKVNEIVISEKKEKTALLSDMHTAHGHCELMNHIINDILDIQKLEEGKLNVENTKIDFGELLRCVSKSIDTKVTEGFYVKYLTDIQDEIYDIVVHSDKHRLQQILLNFLQNAFKFTTQGSVTLKMYINGKNVRIEVIDTGRGIPADKRSFIFKPFHQVKKEDSSPRYGGTGLGLYLCEMLIQLLKGTIGFTSTVNVGTTFWIEIPITYERTPIKTPKTINRILGTRRLNNPVDDSDVKINIYDFEKNNLNTKININDFEKNGHLDDSVELMNIRDSSMSTVVQINDKN